MFPLGRAYIWKDEIDTFVFRNSKELGHLALSDSDWDAILQVTNWLELFHSATTEMSTTSIPMLSSSHAIFRGLQEHLKKIIKDLQPSTPSTIRDGLVASHRKLSDYYYKIDEAPFYLWSSRELISDFVCF